MLSFSSVGDVIIFHVVNVMITINDNIKMITSNDIINDNALKMITEMITQNIYMGK